MNPLDTIRGALVATPVGILEFLFVITVVVFFLGRQVDSRATVRSAAEAADAAKTRYAQVAAQSHAATECVVMPPGSRWSEESASAFNLPARTWLAADENVTVAIFTCPASRSIIAGPPPLYGMWLRRVSVSFAKSAPARCCVLPIPDEA